MKVLACPICGETQVRAILDESLKFWRTDIQYCKKCEREVVPLATPLEVEDVVEG